MIEHVMAALAGLQIDNCIVQIDAGECPGCDGSSRAFVEALDRAGIVEQGRMRQALVLDRSVSVVEGDAILAAHPGVPGGLTLSYHLDYGQGSLIPAQSYCLALVSRDRSGTSWRQPHVFARIGSHRPPRRRDRRAGHRRPIS